MTARTSNAFLLSVTLHGTIIALILLFSFVTTGQTRNMPRVLELVAGEGNNSSATVAPMLGTTDRVKLTVPVPTPPKAEPTPVEVAPIQPAPSSPKPVTPAAVAPKAPNFSNQIRRQVIRAESTAKMQLAREHAAEAKRLAKEEADRAKQAKAAAATPPKFTKIDAAGIAKGVIGGSTENKVGGAGGKALVSDEGSALDRYFSLLKRRLEEALNRPPGLSDTLVATVEFHIAADGTLSGARIVKRSGSAEFDRAVLDAVAAVGSIGARPDGQSETLTLDFRMKETDNG